MKSAIAQMRKRFSKEKSAARDDAEKKGDRASERAMAEANPTFHLEGFAKAGIFGNSADVAATTVGVGSKICVATLKPSASPGTAPRQSSSQCRRRTAS